MKLRLCSRAEKQLLNYVMNVVEPKSDNVGRKVINLD